MTENSELTELLNTTITLHLEEKSDNIILSEINNEEVIKDEIVKEEINNEIIKKNFVELIEYFLQKEEENTTIHISPTIKKFLLIFCKESSKFLESIEYSLQKIILDDKINTKDITEIILLVNKVYTEITNKKTLQKNIEYYELIKTLLHICFIIYLDTNKIENTELLNNALNIINVSIDLIKLKPIKPLKFNCFKFIF